MIVAFLLWVISGLVFVGIGIYCRYAKKAVGFWSNAEQIEVTNIQKYNIAIGKLWIIFGCIFIVLGIPLLIEKNTGCWMISILGGIFALLGLIICYVFLIEDKFVVK